MIVVTGAAGFIGSCLVSRLNSRDFNSLVLVDDFSRTQKRKNLDGKLWMQKIDREDFLTWFDNNDALIDFVFHIGARTDTTEFDKRIFDKLNLNYSKEVWRLCTRYKIPLVYASSAATYGMGECGYDDKHDIIPDLKPLNPYGESKNDFDKWVLKQERTPPFWAGLKFFNVYGPNEAHKGRMASVVYHAYNQIRDAGKVKLFRSHNEEFRDGEQLRDFIYVKDVVEVCLYLMKTQKRSGIYNLGSGKARTFIDLAKGVFAAMNKKEKIEFIDTPEDIREMYQYFTEAKMDKLRDVGYDKKFTSLEEGIKDYVQNYLRRGEYY